MPYIIVFVFGTVVGSFLNVCIYRLPRGYSIVRPSSRCPTCQSPIKAYDNIPLISYILLRGRCRYCGARISLRYPLVEFLNGFLYAVVFWRYGLSPAGFFFMLYMSALIVITFVDLDFQIIPDIITIPGSIIGLIVGIFVLPDSFNRSSALGAMQSILGLLLGFGLYLLIAVLSKGGMGGGDIKMMAMVGAVTGWKGVLLTTFLGSLVGSIVGIGLMVIKKKGRKTKIPFGPFLALGCIVTILFGEEILNFYLNIGH
jgi:leader peptidase (prepilin peptidase)/N-methyltransferase